MKQILSFALLVIALGVNDRTTTNEDVSAHTVTTGASGTEDSRMQLTTYLLFAGTCKDAMTFYHAIFGGELTMTTVGDSPMKAAFPVAMHGRIVSARLKSKVVDISASDWLRPAEKRIQGNAVCLYLSGGNPEDTKSLFGKLSEGAEVTDPLGDQPFGLYGALNDKFGNRWMFHSEKNRREQRARRIPHRAKLTFISEDQ